MRRRFAVLLSVLGILLTTFVVVQPPAAVGAGNTVGSFETDGNKTDDTGTGEPVDWNDAAQGTPPIAITPFTDASSVRKEDGFGGQSHNLTPATWQCANVAVQAKSDIVDGAIGFRTINGKQYVYVNFTRVSNNGTADQDWELNGGIELHPSPSCRGILPARQDGDLLIAFDEQPSLNTVVVSLYRWVGDASNGTLQLVADSTTASGDFDGAMSADRKFGEAVLNMTDLLGHDIECGQFTTAYMKSRASTSVNSDLKDRTSKQPVNLGNCPNSSLQKQVRNVTQNGSFDTTATANPGDVLEYKLTYTNSGPATATNVVVTDNIQDVPTYQTFNDNCVPACTTSGSPTNQVSWTFASVAANNTQTMTFQTQLAASFPPGTTQVRNSAVVDTDQEQPKNSNETTVTVTAAPNFTFTKTATPNPATPGQEVTYTITVTNTGNAAGSVSFVDNYDDRLTLNTPPGVPAGCTNIDTGDKQLQCTTDTIAAGGGTQQFIYKANMPGSFTGSNGTCPPGQYPVTNTVTSNGQVVASLTVCVIASPSFTYSKTANPTTAEPGQLVTYTITVTNNGTAAGSVSFTDNYDDRLTLNNVPTGCTNVAPSGDKQLQCTTSVLAPLGGQQTFVYTANMPSSFTGTPGGAPCTNTQFRIRNVVTVSGQVVASSDVCVNASPHFLYSKTASPTTANPGQLVTYTITVTNDGTASGSVSFTDNYDDRLTLNNVPSGCTNVTTGDKHLDCTTNVLAPLGGQQTFTYTANMPTSFTGTPGGAPCTNTQFRIRNIVTVVGVTVASSDVCVNATPSFSYSKTANPTTANPGQLVTYTITVTNNGPASGSVSFTDNYDDRLTLNNVPTGCTNVTINGDKQLQCTTNVLAPLGGQQTFTYTANMPTSFTGTPGGAPCTNTQFRIRNVVTVSGQVVASSDVCVNASPHFLYSKTANPTTANPGQLVTYTITVTNDGTASGSVSFIDNYDDRLTLNNVPAGCTNVTTGDKHLECTTNVLAPLGGQQQFVYTANMPTSFTTPPGGGTCAPNQQRIVNTVTVVGVTVASSQVCVNVAILNVSKSACPSTVVPGGLVTYTISYSNTGSGSASGVMIVDTIPAGTSVADPGGGTSSGNTVTWNIGTLAPGASGTKTLILLVSAADGSTLTNTVTISASNAASDSDTTQTPVSNAGAITHGNAYGLDINLLGVKLIDRLGLVGTVAPGNPQVDEAELATVPIPGIVTVDLVRQTSESSITTQATSTSTSTVVGLDVLAGAVTADIVKGVSQSVATPFSASANSAGSTFANLKINGSSVANVAPNTKVSIKNPLVPGQTLASAVLYEETKSATFANNKFTANHSVNMIHITLLQPFLTLPAGAQIIVAHADSDATYPSGQACGSTPSTVSGEAFTAFLDGNLLGQDFVDVKVGDAVLLPFGGSDSDGTTVNVPGIASASAASNTTSGSLSPSPNSTSRSQVSGVSLLGGAITADLLDVSCASSTSGGPTTTFSDTLLNLTIGGHPIDANAPPNTTIAVPSNGSVLLVIINEQTVASDSNDTTGTVNALHVFVLDGNGLLNGELIVSSAHCDAHKA